MNYSRICPKKSNEPAGNKPWYSEYRKVLKMRVDEGCAGCACSTLAPDDMENRFKFQKSRCERAQQRATTCWMADYLHSGLDAITMIGKVLVRTVGVREKGL